MLKIKMKSVYRSLYGHMTGIIILHAKIASTTVSSHVFILLMDAKM